MAVFSDELFVALFMALSLEAVISALYLTRGSIADADLYNYGEVGVMLLSQGAPEPPEHVQFRLRSGATHCHGSQGTK